MHIEEAQTVTAMRSQSVRNVRNNFMNMYKYRINCPVQCRDETPHLDTQNHMFHCKILNNSNPLKLTIDNVYDNNERQEQIERITYKIITQRNRLLDEMEMSRLPGHN